MRGTHEIHLLDASCRQGLASKNSELQVLVDKEDKDQVKRIVQVPVHHMQAGRPWDIQAPLAMAVIAFRCRQGFCLLPFV